MSSPPPPGDDPGSRDPRYLSPRVLQTIGLVLLVLFVGIWIATDRESVLLVGVSGSLIMLGGYGRAKDSILELVKPPGPPS